MVGKFTAIVLAIFLFCSCTIAKERNKAHRHDEDTIDIDEPDGPGYVMDGPASDEGSGILDDTERGDDEDYESGTGPIIPGSGVGPDIVPVPVTRRPTTRKTTKKPPTQAPRTRCQQLLKSSSPFKDSYVPRCTKTGEYERTQCRGEECWCVNPGGTTIVGTVKQIHMHTDRPDCEGGSNITPCVYLRVKSEWEQLLGAFNPRCTPTGEFETVQCRERECWCVDSYGQVVDNTMTLLPDQPNCHPTTRTPITEPPIVTKVEEPKYVKPIEKATATNNELGHLNPGEDDDDEDGYETREEETNEVGKDEEMKGDPGAVSSPSIMGQPGILAGIIGGAVVGLLCAILLVMFIVYRMRKKDEGSYALDEPTKARGAYAYQKAPDREFYA